MNPKHATSDRRAIARRRRRAAPLALLLPACLLASSSRSAPAIAPDDSATLAEARLLMGKWIETQQILSKERNEWQQGKEILLGRVDLLKNELATLEASIAEAQSDAADAEGKRAELVAENDALRAAGDELREALAGMEERVRLLFPVLPGPVQEKLAPLRDRIPEDPDATRVSIAERFQNVLGILNEITRSSGDITVSYEVRTLARGERSEVEAIYVGLAQAYYVAASGQAGIGRPGSDGWTWEPSAAIAPDVLAALEILQGKQSPAFVSLPVEIQ